MRPYCFNLAAIILMVLVLILGGCMPPGYQVEVFETGRSQNLKGHQKPYSVNGERYEPLLDHKGFVEEGTASWYGPDFHGKPTSCGEIYDMHAMTAAHKILPLGIFVRVTNQRNGRAVVVRVNDRGPFVKSRIIDLSYAAAKELDVVASGTAPVRVEALGMRNAAGGYTTKNYAVGPYTIQVGAFIDAENAKRLATEMKKRHGSSSIQGGWVNASYFHRVRAGRYTSLAAAEAALVEMERSGSSSAFIVALDEGVLQ